jgi:hypothetical protein
LASKNGHTAILQLLLGAGANGEAKTTVREKTSENRTNTDVAELMQLAYRVGVGGMHVLITLAVLLYYMCAGAVLLL